MTDIDKRVAEWKKDPRIAGTGIGFVKMLLIDLIVDRAKLIDQLKTYKGLADGSKANYDWGSKIRDENIRLKQQLELAKGALTPPAGKHVDNIYDQWCEIAEQALKDIERSEKE